MATLDFLPIENQTRVDELNNGHKLTGGNSPFLDNRVFHVTGFAWRDLIINGVVQEGKSVAVLTTDIGDLFVSMLRRDKCAYDGTIIRTNGTFNVDVKSTIENADRSVTDAQLLQQLVDLAQSRGALRVRRQSYQACGFNKKAEAREIVHIDYFDEPKETDSTANNA